MVFGPLLGLIGSLAGTFAGAGAKNAQTAASVQNQKLQSATQLASTDRQNKQRAGETAVEAPLKSAQIEEDAFKTQVSAFRDALLRNVSGRVG